MPHGVNVILILSVRIIIYRNGVLGMLPEDMKEFCENGLISPERMRAVDKNAVSLGVEAIRLMESEGKSLAEMALE